MNDTFLSYQICVIIPRLEKRLSRSHEMKNRINGQYQGVALYYGDVITFLSFFVRREEAGGSELEKRGGEREAEEEGK